MPIDYVEGFDRYAESGSLNFQSRWVAQLNTNNLAFLIGGRFGARAIRFQSQAFNGYIERLATSSAKYGMQCAFLANLAELHTDGFLIARWLDVSSNVIVGWGVNQNGQIYVTRGGTTFFISEGFAITNNSWAYVEMHVEVSTTVGKIILRVNGETLYSGTGLNLGSANTHRIRFAFDDTGVPFGIHRYAIDDLITSYNEDDTPGESAALVLTPSADVAVDFTRLSGAANFEMVDEQQVDSESTYNSSTTVGHRDIFELQNFTTTPDEVKGLFVSIAARKTDSATRRLEYFFEIGGVEYSIETVFLGGNYQFFEKVVELNPATGLPWTVAQVNATRIGYRVIE